MLRIKYYKSEGGYGRSWTLVWRGQHRVRICSPGSMTRMWPHFYLGSDEDCNRAISLHLWPLFGIDVWWEVPYRYPGSGLCTTCLEFMEELND